MMSHRLFASHVPSEIRLMRNYFISLPADVQENFLQSGVQLHSVEEMHTYAENYMRQFNFFH